MMQFFPLEKAFPANSPRMTLQHQDSSFDVSQHERTDPVVIPDQIRLGEAVLGPHEQTGIGECLPGAWQTRLFPGRRCSLLRGSDPDFRLSQDETLLIGDAGLCSGGPQLM